jgi:predicted Zn-dependent protease
MDISEAEEETLQPVLPGDSPATREEIENQNRIVRNLLALLQKQKKLVEYESVIKRARQIRPVQFDQMTREEQSLFAEMERVRPLYFKAGGNVEINRLPRKIRRQRGKSRDAINRIRNQRARDGENGSMSVSLQLKCVQCNTIKTAQSNLYMDASNNKVFCGAVCQQKYYKRQ